MKFKKQVILLCASIAILTCWLCMSVSYAFEGHYLGTAVGGLLHPVNHFGDKITQITPMGSNYNYCMSDKWSSARTPSFMWHVTYGYGKIFGKHYCGAEGMLHRARHRLRSSISNKQLALDTHDELTVAMRDMDVSLHYRQGYAITDTFMIFGKIGFSRNKVKMHIISNSLMKYPDQNYNFAGYLAKRKTVYPLKIALELEKKFWDNDFALTLAYTYERPGSIKLQGIQTMTTAGGIMRKEFLQKVTVQSSAILFGLKRYW